MMNQASQGTSEVLETSPVPTPTPLRPLETDYVSFPTTAPLKPSGSSSKHVLIVQSCYISLAAMLGCFLRIIMAQLFGEECANPGSIGWLASAAPLCVTKDGDTVQEGGIVFSDLPANIFGCFCMGLWQNSVVLGLVVPMAVLWLPPDHVFQKWTILHTAFTTGFCGSLTTFSSWNSEMVVMLFGTGNANLQTHIVRALLGYIIGMETALGSLACGRSVALRLFRYGHPALAAEWDVAKERLKQGIPLHSHLTRCPGERRFLNATTCANTESGLVSSVPPMLPDVTLLSQWRDSTEPARRVGHQLWPLLQEIEAAVLNTTAATVDDDATNASTKKDAATIVEASLTPQAKAMARAEGWDIDALLQWKQLRSSTDVQRLPSLGSLSVQQQQEQQQHSQETLLMFQPIFALSLLAAVYLFLFLGLIVLNDPDKMTIETYRTMVYALLLAPGGALLRWKLSAWNTNGKCTWQDWEWLPLGTLTVNLLGSCLSALAVGGEYHHLHGRFSEGYSGFWVVGTIRAVKVGFAGCLTTVSTFAVEVSGFMQSGSDHAYPYIGISLGGACLGASVFYAAVVLLLPEPE